MSQVIGVVAQSSMLYGPVSTLNALARAALRYGFTVSVESVRAIDPQSISDAIGRHCDQQVAGLLVIAPVESANEALDAIPDDIPLVTIDGDPRLRHPPFALAPCGRLPPAGLRARGPGRLTPGRPGHVL